MKHDDSVPHDDAATEMARLHAAAAGARNEADNLRTELERIKQEIEVIAERADIRGETATAARLRRLLRY